MEVKKVSLEKPEKLPFLVQRKKSDEVYLVSKAKQDCLVFTILSNYENDFDSFVLANVDFEYIKDYLIDYEVLPKGFIVELTN